MAQIIPSLLDAVPVQIPTVGCLTRGRLKLHSNSHHVDGCHQSSLWCRV